MSKKQRSVSFTERGWALYRRFRITDVFEEEVTELCREFHPLLYNNPRDIATVAQHCGGIEEDALKIFLRNCEPLIDTASLDHVGPELRGDY